MTDVSGPPSGNPADAGSLTGVMRAAMDKFAQGLDDCLPCKVIAVTVENGKRFVTVHPQIMMGTTSGEKISRAQVSRVPVYQLSAGGFVLSCPVKQGDFGWLKATDRDMSLFLQGLSEEWPNTTRKHSFQDGVFFPDRMRSFALAEDDQDRMVLQSEDGATRIALGATEIEIETPGDVRVTAAMVTFNGPVTFSGAVQFDSTATFGDKEFFAHRHTGVAVGAGVSGTVQP